jgi:hypothetical protein
MIRTFLGKYSMNEVLRTAACGLIDAYVAWSSRDDQHIHLVLLESMPERRKL